MPNSFDVLKANQGDRILPIPVDYTNLFPELNFFEAVPVPEIIYNAAIAVPDETQAAFRLPNVGTQRKTTNIVTRPVECKLLDASWDVDIGAARAYHRDDSEIYALASETAIRSQMAKICRQIWHGTVNDPDGFEGLNDKAALQAGQTGGVGITNASGSTGAGQYNYIYFVRTGELFTQLAWGKNGVMRIDPMFPAVKTFTNGTEVNIMSQSILAWCGLQIGSEYSYGILRHKVGGNVTDKDIFTLLEKFRRDFTPTAIFMGRQSAAALRASRTSFNPFGLPPAPITSIQAGYMNESEIGIPIYVTEHIGTVTIA